MKTGNWYEIPCSWGEMKKAKLIRKADADGCECSVCGKTGKTFYSFTDMDGLELLVGSSCIKKVRDVYLIPEASELGQIMLELSCIMGSDYDRPITKEELLEDLDYLISSARELKADLKKTGYLDNYECDEEEVTE